MMELDLNVDVMKIDEKIQSYHEVALYNLFVGLVL